MFFNYTNPQKRAQNCALWATNSEANVQYRHSHPMLCLLRPIFTVLAAFILCACSAGPTPIRVFVASSMTDFVNELATEFQISHPSTDLEINIAGSAALLAQLAEGAKADILILASERHTLSAQASYELNEPVIVASNALALIVPRGNPADISSVEDLQVSSLRGSVCIPAAPCGELAFTFAQKSALSLSGATQESNVRAVLARVARAEVEFGFVYKTDVTAADGDVVQIPAIKTEELRTSYSIAAMKESLERPAVNDFLEAATSASARSILFKRGFSEP